VIALLEFFAYTSLLTAIILVLSFLYLLDSNN